MKLTTPQYNIWNLQKYYEKTSIANNCGALFFEEKCDHSLMKKALNRLIMIQEGMRLQFCEIDGNPSQYIADYQEQNFEEIIFENRAALEEYVAKMAKIPFYLTDTPQYRFVIFDVDGITGILMCISHLISDAWSVGLIVNTISEGYRALQCGQEPEICSFSYESIIESEENYRASEKYEQDKTYWNDCYCVQPEHSPIKAMSTAANHPLADRYTTVINKDLAKEISILDQKRGISPAVLFEAAIFTYLTRINPENKTLSIGVPVLNRSNALEKKIVGMCISTMPLTLQVDREQSAEKLCKTITKAHFQIFRHQKYPYSNILRNLREHHEFTGNLYDVLVSYQNARTGVNATSTQWFSNGYSEVPMQVHIDNRDSSDGYTLNIDYQTKVFSEKEIQLFVNRILHIIHQIIDEPEVSLDRISILPENERNMVLYDFNDTQVEYSDKKCVHELFAERAAETPDKTALVFEDRSFNYCQLDEMSNSLAHVLRSRGIGKNDVVPFVCKRSWHVIVAILGILKAGAAYMPVDPAYPPERISYMLETGQCKLALTYGYYGLLNDIETIDLEKFDYTKNTASLGNVNSAEDLCYVIFTSGSTGKPKGVSLCHRNVVNYCDDNEDNVCHSIIQADSQSIVSVTNVIFDIFVTESLLPLLNGITIYFANDEQVFSQKKLSELIRKYPIDVIQTTPTKMRSYLLNRQDIGYLKRLKAIVMGGEAFPIDLYQELRKDTDAEIYNIYGPAETTVWSTNKHITDEKITIGKPIANTQIYILDSEHNPLPVGVAGELCISGDGVGKGYLNRPELTAEKFISNPFVSGKVMYCTGDLARWRADGEIEYLGRIDTQVKIRGLRIELGEIESVMAEFSGVALAAAADKKDESGRQYLVGYYTSSETVDEKALRQHLTGKLPKYMVPNYFVHLEVMPMTASGKTDRKNLPLPDFTTEVREYTAPENDRERDLCNLLGELFDMLQIGVTDDFFELGGDSLRAIEYVAKAHNIGIEFPLQSVFDYPTVKQLCIYLQEGGQHQSSFKAEDFVKYQPLLKGNIIKEDFVPCRHSIGNVFLTGATGFLGAHVIDAFLKNEDGKIYCLVRGRKERLVSVLKYYFGNLYSKEIGKRIIPIVGDITDLMSNENLPEDVQTVIHTAATVKHYGSYDYFYGVNVEGTKNVIDYAKKQNAKLLHISTVSVSGNSLADDFEIVHSTETKYFKETDLFIDQPLENVYVRSKFEGECAVLDAVLEGLDAKIIRVGNLTNRLSDFKFQPNYQSNAFLTRFKAALDMGIIPDYLMSLYLEFSAIDQTAEGVVKIGQYADQTQKVFHLNSNRTIHFDRLLEVLHMLGVSMDVVSGKEFNRILQKFAKETDTEYIYEAFQNDLDSEGKLMYDSNIHIENDFTAWFMKKLGFEWERVDYDYLKGYIDYFRNLGYFM